MVNVLPRLNSMFSLVGKACAVLLLAGASMLAGSGRAQAQHYVTIQPIVICQTPLGGKVTTTTTPGRGCAPINCLGNASGSPDCQATLVGSLGSPTNPIGFFDTTSKDDVTWAIWNQLGITVAWVLPVLILQQLEVPIDYRHYRVPPRAGNQFKLHHPLVSSRARN